MQLISRQLNGFHGRFFVMGIDVETEEVITLGEGCRTFPPTGISTATMARLIQKGIKV